MRVHVDDRPRIESISTSSAARNLATSACLLFQLSRPSCAASLSGDFATTTSGIFDRGLFAVDFAREGATRRGLTLHLAKVRGQRASPRPSASSFAASSSNCSNEPGAESMPACGSPNSAKRLGTVSTVKSDGSQSGTSCQCSGVDTRASATGRTEYAEQVVRSLAF